MDTDRFRWRVYGAECVYCGDRANSVDHWPPRSYGAYGLLMPACKECNSLLGTMHPTSLGERIKTLKYLLRVRYAKYLRIPDWSEDELCEMGHAMHSSIVVGIAKKHVVRKRIAWNVESYLSLIDDYSSIVAFSAECEVRMLNAKRSWTRTEMQIPEPA